MHHFAAKPRTRRVFTASNWPISYEPKKRAGSVLIPVYTPYITNQLSHSRMGRPKVQIAGNSVQKTRLQKGE